MSEEKLKKELEKSKKDYQLLEQDFMNFVYAVSHDLQAPARAMNIFSKLILENPNGDSEDLELYSKFVKQGGDKLMKMLQGLLDFFHITQKSLQIEERPFQSLLDNALDLIGDEIQLSRSNLQIKGEELSLKADPELSVRLLLELLKNAKQFSKEGSEIKVTFAKNADSQSFEIHSFGDPIEEKFQEKIFQIFFQVTKKEGSSHIGIGLSLAKKIADLHEGSIEINSHDGWNCFKVNFPN